MNQKLGAMEWAIEQHAKTNHQYNGQPYSTHLKAVVDTAIEYLHLMPEEAHETVLSACWAHDTIEDCRVTYNDVKEALGEQVAEIVYALTNEKGKNRKQRANDKYYRGIRNTPYATFVKLCDRIANFEYSINTQSKMAIMYAKENKYFCDQLVDSLNGTAYVDMADYLFKLEEQAKQLK